MSADDLALFELPATELGELSAVMLVCGAQHVTRIARAELDAFWARHGYSRCHCGRPARQDVIQGTYKADRRCDSRCTSARGPVCVCACGGHNHGADRVFRG